MNKTTNIREEIVLHDSDNTKLKQLKLDYILSEDIREKQHLKFVIWQLENNK